MAEDKEKQERKVLKVGVATDSFDKIACGGCGVEIDVRGIEAFSEIECPSCKHLQAVPARLANFRLLKVLGAGGMGAVFLAQDDRLNRKVAIKVMLSSIGEDPSVLATFRKEAQAAARLNHPNIVQIYSFGEEKGQPYLVMELVNGGSLDGCIKSGQPLDPAFVMRVGMEISEGLTAAQNAELLHGDIKPENILFDDKMQSKLVDFGIASMIGSKGQKEIWGTPYYIAPEKARRQKEDQRSDIYSLGATLYHAIAGKPPFDGEDPIAVIKARFSGPAQPLAEIRPGINPQVVQIIDRMMQPNLFLRYPNYGSLIKDMKQYLALCPDIAKAGPRLFRSSSTGLIDLSDDPSAPSTGRKKLVIQRGSTAAALQMERQAAAMGGGPSTATGSLQPDEPETGRKGFRLRKRRGRLRGDGADGEPAEPLDPEVVKAMEEAAELRRRKAARATLITIATMVSLVVIGIVGALVAYGVKQSRERKAMDAMYVAASKFDRDTDALNISINAIADKVKLRDDEAMKLIGEMGDLYKRALGVDLVIPDLEPLPEPEPAAAEEVAEGAAAAGEAGQAADKPAEAPKAEPAPAPAAAPSAPQGLALPRALQGIYAKIRKGEEITDEDKLNAVIMKVADDEQIPENVIRAQIESGERNKVNGAFGAAPAGAGGVDAAIAQIRERVNVAPRPAASADAPASAEAAPAADAVADPLMARLEPMFEEARAIRKFMRAAESMRSYDVDVVAIPKREKFGEGIWRAYKDRHDKRLAMQNEMEGFIAECDAALRRMRNTHRTPFMRDAQRLIDEKRRLADEAEQKRLAELAEEKRKRDEENRKQEIDMEIAKINDVIAANEAAIKRYEYQRVARSLERLEAELGYQESKDWLDAKITIMRRLESLKRFIVQDLHKNKGLKWGLGSSDIVDANSSGVVALGGRTVPFADLKLGEMMNIYDKTFVNRDPNKASIRSVELGDQLFNVALFCDLHGGEVARLKTLDYLKRTMKRKSALKTEIMRLMPQFQPSEYDELDPGFGGAGAGGGLGL